MGRKIIRMIFVGFFFFLFCIFLSLFFSFWILFSFFSLNCGNVVLNMRCAVFNSKKRKFHCGWMFWYVCEMVENEWKPSWSIEFIEMLGFNQNLQKENNIQFCIFQLNIAPYFCIYFYSHRYIHIHIYIDWCVFVFILFDALLSFCHFVYKYYYFSFIDMWLLFFFSFGVFLWKFLRNIKNELAPAIVVLIFLKIKSGLVIGHRWPWKASIASFVFSK